MKLILFMLANKTDERFSGYPAINMLTSESGADRSTVVHALKALESQRYFTRRAQYHQSGHGSPAAITSTIRTRGPFTRREKHD